MKGVMSLAFVLLILSSSAQQMAPNGYYVQGNQVFNESHEEVKFRGVNRPSLEWNARGKWVVRKDFESMKDACVNIVRVPLNQYYWLNNIHDYQSRIDTVIKWCMEEEMTVILDLHRSQKDDINHDPRDIYEHADQLSLDFWYDLATRYQSNGKLIFELYNEPHYRNSPSDRPRLSYSERWNNVVNGGVNDNQTVSDGSDDWVMPGYQKLYDTVRAAGAHNLVIVGGDNWSYDLSYYESNPIAGYNIMYATHCYPIPGKYSSNWKKWTVLASEHPVIATEFGPSSDSNTVYIDELRDTMEVVGAHWVAWAWYPFNQNNMWTSGAVFDPANNQYDTSYFGEWLFQELADRCEGDILNLMEADEVDVKGGVYPNPVNETLFISAADGGLYEVFDENGKVLSSGTYSSEGINVSWLSAGFYLLKIEDKVYRFAK